MLESHLMMTLKETICKFIILNDIDYSNDQIPRDIQYYINKIIYRQSNNNLIGIEYAIKNHDLLTLDYILKNYGNISLLVYYHDFSNIIGELIVKYSFINLIDEFMLLVDERHLTTRFINSILNNIYKYNNIIVLEHIGLNFEEHLKHYIDNYLFINYQYNQVYNLVKVYINHDKFELIKKHLIKSAMFHNNYDNWIQLIKYTFEINNIKLCKNIIYYSMKVYISNGYINRKATRYYYELSCLAILYNNPKILELIIHNIDNKNEFIELKSFAIRNKCNYQIIELIEDNFKKLN